MKQTKITQISKIYADVLMSLENKISLDTVHNDINTVKDVLDNSSDLRDFVINPLIPDFKKSETIDEIFKNNISDSVILFLKQLIEKKRFSELNEIVKAFEYKLNEKNNIKEITVTSAINLNDDFKRRIIVKLESRLHTKTVINWQTDVSILGGLIVKYDDNIIDLSLYTRIKELSKQIR